MVDWICTKQNFFSCKCAKFQLVMSFLVSGSPISRLQNLYWGMTLWSSKNGHAYFMFMCRPLLLFKKKVLSALVLYRASLVKLKQHLLHSCITWKYTYRCSTQFDSPLQSPSITHTARLEMWPTRLQRSHSRYILLHIQSLQTQSLQTQSLRTYYKVESFHSELLDLLKIRGERQKKLH